MKPNTADAPIRGLVSVNSKGIGFIENPHDKTGEDLEIPADRLHTALHKDEVEVKILPLKNRNRQLAEVTKIVKRAKMRFVGVLHEAKNGFALVPDDQRLYKDIFVATADSLGGKVEDKVYVEITEWD